MASTSTGFYIDKCLLRFRTWKFFSIMKCSLSLCPGLWDHSRANLCHFCFKGEKLIIQGNVQDLINSKIVTTESVQQYRQAYLQDIEDNETGNAQSGDNLY